MAETCIDTATWARRDTTFEHVKGFDIQAMEAATAASEVPPEATA